MRTAECVKVALVCAAVVAVAWLACGQGQGEARAQGLPTIGSGGDYEFIATNNGKDIPVLFIIDKSARRFAMYTQRQPGQPNQFKLFVARRFDRDLEMDDLADAPNGYSLDDVEKRIRQPSRGR